MGQAVRAPAGTPGPLVSLVVAMADEGVIGRGGTLPWHLPDDLKHFRAVTIGKPVLMGRRTFEAIGRALPGRRNLVLSRGQGRTLPEGAEWVGSLEEALARVAEAPELAVVGGREIYALALPRTRRIHLTRVHARIEGDVRFPWPPPDGGPWPGWSELTRSEHPADARHAYAMSFLRLERE